MFDGVEPTLFLMERCKLNLFPAGPLRGISAVPLAYVARNLICGGTIFFEDHIFCLVNPFDPSKRLAETRFTQQLLRSFQ